MGKTCVIIGSGEVYPDMQSQIRTMQQQGAYLIAADGGYDFLQKHALIPDLLIGDFDSIKQLTAVSANIEIIRLQPEKDDTDTVEAVGFALQRKYTEIHLFGGTGKRFDHTMANIHCLVQMAKHGVKGFLYSEQEVMTVLHNDSICFSDKAEGNLSIFSLIAQSSGVCEQGFKYELDNYTVTNDYPIGVSNQFCGVPAKVDVQNGTLLVIFPVQALSTIQPVFSPTLQRPQIQTFRNGRPILYGMQAAVFDLDGTLLDSNHIWEEIDHRFLQMHGITPPEDLTKEYHGMSFWETAVYTKERFQIPGEPQDYIDEWTRMAEYAYANELTLFPGAKDYLQELKTAGIKIALATSAYDKLYKAALSHNGIADLFDYCCTSDFVGKGKQFPDIYLHACAQLTVNPAHCVVFEDIERAILSAKAAGATVIGVNHASPACFAIDGVRTINSFAKAPILA